MTSCALLLVSVTTGGPTVPYKDTDIQKKRDIANDPGVEFYSTIVIAL